MSYLKIHVPAASLVCVNPAAIATTFDLHETHCLNRVKVDIHNHRGNMPHPPQMMFRESPVSSVFGGELRSVLQRQGVKESATVEPFFSLQLDIQVQPVCMPNCLKMNFKSGVYPSDKFVLIY